MVAPRKSFLLRLDPAIHDALAGWAHDELRSTNAQVEFLLRRALREAGRLPTEAGAPARRGRPRKKQPDEPTSDDEPPGRNTDAE